MLFSPCKKLLLITWRWRKPPLQRRNNMREYGDLNGDEDDIAYENQLIEENNPNDEPNFDDWEVV